jgi:8-oxo-dGTP diphosphatase
MLELAGGVIVNEQNQILLLHRQTEQLTQWELPVGKLESGESPVNAAIRELREELGIETSILAELGAANIQDRDQTILYHRFLVAVVKGQPKPQEEIFDAVRYFSISELKTRSDLSANVQDLLLTFKDGFGNNAGSQLRRNRNELLIQQDNARIKNLAEVLLDAKSQKELPLSLECECSDLNCHQSIEISAADYSKIYNHSAWFALFPGHENLDIEQIIFDTKSTQDSKYIIVEKKAIRSNQLVEI